MARIATLLLAATILATQAGAATLRQATTLRADTVRLADLFDDSGPDAAHILGPAPAPGARIVVEAGQLTAIARQFGVPWRSASPADRIVLDRPGRILPREDILAALRAALAGIGAPADAQLDLPGFAAPMVALDAHPQTTVEQLDFDAAAGRFTGSLAITGDGMAMRRMRLSGTLREMVDRLTPAHRLPAGRIIAPGDLVATQAFLCVGRTVVRRGFIA